MREWVLGCVIAIGSREASAQPTADPPPPVQEIAPEEPAPPPPVPAAKPPEHVHTMDEVTIPQSNLRFGINFFGDASLAATTPDEPHSAFTIGTLGVRLLGELGPSLDALGELAFETTDAGPLADIEQLALRWRRGAGTLQVGRFHTDFGYWNTAYHHGLWLQTPVERPHVLRFEDDGGIVPVHWVGAQYALEVKGVAVVAGLANGRGEIVDDIRVNDDTNDAKAALVKVRVKTSTLEAGIGVIYDVIAPAPAMVRPALPDRRLHEILGNVYLALRIPRGPLLIAEGYAFRHQGGGESWTTLSGYGLFGFAVTDRVTPYAAVDVVSGADEDPFFTPDPAVAAALDLVEVMAGVRIDTSTWSALKFELRFTNETAATEDDYTAVANWSFGL